MINRYFGTQRQDIHQRSFSHNNKRPYTRGSSKDDNEKVEAQS